jgi:hypothetical protein
MIEVSDSFVVGEWPSEILEAGSGRASSTRDDAALSGVKLVQQPPSEGGKQEHRHDRHQRRYEKTE